MDPVASVGPCKWYLMLPDEPAVAVSFNDLSAIDVWKYADMSVLPVGRLVVHHDRRVDPDDACAYLFHEFWIRHKREYSMQDIVDYWITECVTDVNTCENPVPARMYDSNAPDKGVQA
jgi:hypothetical protein